MVSPIVRALYRDIMYKAEQFDNNAALKTLPKNSADSSFTSNIMTDLFGSADAVAYKPDSRKVTEMAKEWFRNSAQDQNMQHNIGRAFESIKAMNTVLKIEEAWNMQSCNVEDSAVPPLFSGAQLLPEMPDSIRPGTVLLAHPMLNLTLFRFSCVLITDHDPSRGTRGVIFNLPYAEHIQQQDCAVKFWHDDLSYSYLREALVPFTQDMVKGTGFEGDFSGTDTTTDEPAVAFDDTLVRQMQESMWDTYGKKEGSKIDAIVSQILHSSGISPLIKDDEYQNQLKLRPEDIDAAFDLTTQLGLQQGTNMLHYGGPFEESQQPSFLVHDPSSAIAQNCGTSVQRVSSDLLLLRDTKQINEMVQEGSVESRQVKALQGSVLWEAGQLERETLQENLWFMMSLPSALITEGTQHQQLMWMWSHAMKALGGEYRHLGNWYSALLPNGRMMNMSSKQIARNILQSLPKAELESIRE